MLVPQGRLRCQGIMYNVCSPPQRILEAAAGRLRTSHLGGVGVRAHLLASGSSFHVHAPPVELHALLRPARGELLLLLRLHLGGLPLHLTSASERAVHLTAAAEAKHKVESRLLLDVVIAEVAKTKGGDEPYNKTARKQSSPAQASCWFSGAQGRDTLA